MSDCPNRFITTLYPKWPHALAVFNFQKLHFSDSLKCFSLFQKESLCKLYFSDLINYVYKVSDCPNRFITTLYPKWPPAWAVGHLRRTPHILRATVYCVTPQSCKMLFFLCHKIGKIGGLYQNYFISQNCVVSLTLFYPNLPIFFHSDISQLCSIGIKTFKY